MTPQQYRQRRDQLQEFFQQFQRLPTYQEMLDMFKLKSKNTVAYWVNKFIEDGLLIKDEQGHLMPGSLARPLKLLGTIKAGFPSPAEEDLLDTISLDQYLHTHKPSLFMLKVSSDSMIDAGIHPGDLVLVDRSRNARLGDIVVAEVDGEWTLKRYARKQGQVILEPANPAYHPIYPQSTLSFGGVVTAVVRKYQ